MQQAEEQARQDTARAQVLARVAARLNAPLDLQTVLSVVCEETARALKVPFATVALYDDQCDALYSVQESGSFLEHRQPVQPMPRALYEQAVRQQGPIVIIPDLQAFPHLLNANLHISEDARTLMFASMMREGQLVGTLAAITFDQVRSFGEDEQALLQGLADQAALAITNPRLFEAIQRELAERKRTEEELRESHQLLSKMFASLHDAVFIVDADTATIIDCNPAAEQMLGYSRAEMVGREVGFLHVSEVALEQLRRHLHSAVEERGFLFLSEFTMKRKDGTTFPAEHSVTSLEGEQGQRIGWVSIVRDITQHKQAEEQVKQLRENLERRANELAALNKASQAIASTLDFESVLKLVIGEVRGLLDAEGASVLLRDPASDELVFAAVAGVGAQELAAARMPITQGIAGWVIRNRQHVLLEDAQSDPRFYPSIDQKTGLTTRSVVAVPLRFKGAVWGVVEAVNSASGVFGERDVELLEALARSAAIALENARLYQAEQELRRLVEQSRVQLAQSEKLAATGRLAATLAHEVNNPLQAIYNCLQMMRDFQLEPDEHREYLQIAIGEVERLTDTVSHTLDLARQPQQGMKPAQLNQVVERVLALTGKYLQHRHVALQHDLSPDLPLILASPDELVQVFLNLVLNAADAMAEGGILRITSRLAEDGRLAVAFSDTGCGIRPEHLNRIFEPFFSTKEGSTGMGLDISNKVVKQHRGEITVESQVDKGSTFTVWLPVGTR
jgi:PAS domain S-box-containing protein